MGLLHTLGVLAVPLIWNAWLVSADAGAYAFDPAGLFAPLSVLIGAL